jgi:hypothetical protein
VEIGTEAAQFVLNFEDMMHSATFTHCKEDPIDVFPEIKTFTTL